MKVGIIDSRDNSEFWENSLGSSFECAVASDMSKLTECDVIFVSADYCGSSIGTVIENLRSSDRFGDIPAAAFVNENSCEEQEHLLSLGFDDIICQPVCSRLLVRRAKALALMHSCDEETLSVENLMDEKDGGEGAYCVCSVDFSNIFRFVMRVLERTGKDAQILVLKLNSDRNKSTAASKSVMSTLSEAVRMCLRRGDMSSVCGDNEMLVLLIGADDEGGHLVASRIVNSFYSECTDDTYELSYDIREVKAAE
ncbi:MAG: hypothetical protein K6G33_04325 [Ruminococcus sp.]|uniref:hypothetical protein n=1 Tax=Ruminococcus sp. TaxID=41978 RepID=UPI0025D16E7D|nr:hypothetical protein [Ruminococcus sp.]MCR5599952.1 hypothetical protein [Ruminococcus sp.]